MCVAHSTVSVRWWRVTFEPGALWRGVVPTPQSPPSPECRDRLMIRAWEERLSPWGLYHYKTGTGAAVWTRHQSKRNGDVRDLGTLFWDSPGLPLAPSVWKFSFLSLFFFWASWKLLLFRWFSAHRRSPCFCMLSQRGECAGLQHVFICCPLDQLPACGFQVGSNQLVGLHSPYWVWAGVPFHSLWSSSCVDPGVSFLKYTTCSYKYRLQACRRPCMAVVSL